MKRVDFEKHLETNSTLKKQCIVYFDKFKESHTEWSFDKRDNSFSQGNRVHAYILDGIIYDEGHKAIDLTDLDIPHISHDVWYLIMRFIDGKLILHLEDMCLRMAKAAARTWKDRGRKLSKQYGPVFVKILKSEKMTFQDFFHLCETSVWSQKWLPFQVLFSLPPGYAKEYIGFGGPCNATYHDEVKDTYGVIRTQSDTYAGYFKKKAQRNVTFYWDSYLSKKGHNITSNRGNSLMESFLKDLPIKSPISKWNIYIFSSIPTA